MSNRYYDHRHEIRNVRENGDWPVDIATDIVRKRHGWSVAGDDGKELQEWRKMCREYQLAKDKTLADLFK